MNVINYPFSVERRFVELALQTEFNCMKEVHGTPPNIALWDDYLEMLVSEGSLLSTPHAIVKDYFTKGVFFSRGDMSLDSWIQQCQGKCSIYTSRYAMQ